MLSVPSQQEDEVHLDELPDLDVEVAGHVIEHGCRRWQQQEVMSKAERNLAIAPAAGLVSDLNKRTLAFCAKMSAAEHCCIEL
eukprot:7509290-Ditylum_brightwellii.AAC.1